MIRSDGIIPQEMIAFIAAQLDIREQAIFEYAQRSQIHYEHTVLLKELYKFHSFFSANKSLITWLKSATERVRSNLELVETFVEECCSRKILLPGVSISPTSG